MVGVQPWHGALELHVRRKQSGSAFSLVLGLCCCGRRRRVEWLRDTSSLSALSSHRARAAPSPGRPPVVGANAEGHSGAGGKGQAGPSIHSIEPLGAQANNLCLRRILAAKSQHARQMPSIMRRPLSSLAASNSIQTKLDPKIGPPRLPGAPFKRPARANWGPMLQTN